MFIKNDGLLFSATSEGFYHINKKSSLNDIISEWSDVEIPWEDYPTWCNWVAMDKNGLWFAYSIEPRCIDATDRWTVGGAYFIPSEYAPKGFSGDWKESKFERPKKD